MLSLILAGIFFIAVHIGVSGTALRGRAVGLLGRRGYMVAFSVASIAGIWWLIAAYNGAAYVPTWGQPEWWKLVADVLMLPAFLLVVIGLATPNPTAVGQERLADQPPTGIVRVTRHPFLIGVALWAFLHLVANGDARLGAVVRHVPRSSRSPAPPSIDAKRRRTLGRRGLGRVRLNAPRFCRSAPLPQARNTLDLGRNPLVADRRRRARLRAVHRRPPAHHRGITVPALVTFARLACPTLRVPVHRSMHRSARPVRRRTN